MHLVEIAIVVVTGALGVRSFVHWIRRPFDGTDARDHALFAVFVTGRVGLWFAVAGVFLLYAVSGAQGRAFVDDVRQFQWFLIVFLALAVAQLLAGFFLGRRPPAP